MSDKCKNCGSEDTSWFTALRTNAQDGRIKLNEISTTAVLACNDCSETIKSVPVEKYLAELESELADANRKWSDQKIQNIELEAELEAIKYLLPKTADGYTVFPGNIVWPLYEIDDEQGAEVVIMLRDVETEEILEDAEISDNYFKRQGKKEQS